MHNKLVAWGRLMVITVLLPLFILGSGAFYMTSLEREMRFRQFETEASEKLETMRMVAGTEKYLCNSITGIFEKSKDAQELQQAVADFSRQHELPLNFLIWGPSGNIFYADFDYKKTGGDWEAAFSQMKDIARRAFKGGERNIPPELVRNVRLVFGPHFFPRYYGVTFTGRNIRLIRPDSTKNRPLTWLNVSDRFGLTVLFDYSVLDSSAGLRHMVNTASGNLTAGFVENGKIVCRDPVLVEQLQSSSQRLQRSFSNHLDIAGYYVFTNFISGNLTGFCAIKKTAIETFSARSQGFVILLILLSLLLAFAIFSFRVMVQKAQLTLGIRRQLLLLFVVANSLPGFILLVIGSDYLQQLRTSLLNGVYNQSMAYLQSIDELYGNEYTVQKDRFNKHFPDLKAALRKNLVNRETMHSFIKEQSPEPYRIFLVASSTGLVAGTQGTLKNGKVHEAFKKSFKTDTIRINTMDAMFKLGTYVLAYLNKTPFSTKMGTEVEFIAESLMQKKPAELIRLFFERGTFWQWGIGSKKHPTYIDIFQLSGGSQFDYLLLYLWDSVDIELEFIKRIFHNLNRNEFGFSIMAVTEFFHAAFPEEILKNRRMMEFALKLRDRTITRPEFFLMDGEEYLLAGHKCIFMETIRLFATYPVDRIDQQVAAKKNLLLLLVFISLLVSISLGLFVASGILQPLAELQAGVGALQTRNFAYRLPALGGDEFGNLADIFNSMLVDLEEMHVASTVQEKLMTQMTEPARADELLFFGQTISLAGMGGDYFELFTTDHDRPALVLGDVTGRGVGTCLLLAFVKSAIMQIQDKSSQPQIFMTTMNDLINRSSQAGQSRSINLQYLYLAGGNRIELVNAGLPDPLLLDHASGEITVLPMTSQPLGHALLPALSHTAAELARGQSLVCFTGGMLRNGGVDTILIAELLQRTRSANPQEFAGRFLEEYFKLTSRSDCTDDVSLIIIHHSES